MSVHFTELPIARFRGVALFFMGYHYLITAKSPGGPNELLRNLCFPPLAIFLPGISGQMRWPPFRDALR